eukprot:4498549-Pleurochrysis_carterae.AAC.1
MPLPAGLPAVRTGQLSRGAAIAGGPRRGSHPRRHAQARGAPRAVRFAPVCRRDGRQTPIRA